MDTLPTLYLIRIVVKISESRNSNYHFFYSYTFNIICLQITYQCVMFIYSSTTHNANSFIYTALVNFIMALYYFVVPVTYQSRTFSFQTKIYVTVTQLEVFKMETAQMLNRAIFFKIKQQVLSQIELSYIQYHVSNTGYQ